MFTPVRMRKNSVGSVLRKVMVLERSITKDVGAVHPIPEGQIAGLDHVGETDLGEKLHRIQPVSTCGLRSRTGWQLLTREPAGCGDGLMLAHPTDLQPRERHADPRCWSGLPGVTNSK